MTTSGPNGSSFSHLIGQLDRRLERIEEAIDRLADHQTEHAEKIIVRVTDLEKKNSEIKGGWTVLTIIGTIAGTVGGIAARWLGG